MAGDWNEQQSIVRITSNHRRIAGGLSSALDGRQSYWVLMGTLALQIDDHPRRISQLNCN